MIKELNLIGTIDDKLVIGLQQAVSTFTEPPESLTVNISSAGGNVNAGVTMYNYLKSLPYPVTCHNLGEVSSAAILPYLAGSERTAEQFSKFMFHPLEIGLNGSMPLFKIHEISSNLESDIDTYEKIVLAEVPNITDTYNIRHFLECDSLVLTPCDAYTAGIVTRLRVTTDE